MTNEMTGGEALARMIAAHKGGPMFGMGGFQLLPFYDAARRLGLSHHLINDERAGVFAADAYAKVSGRVGLADATLGPGATNLVTGLVESLNAGTPMVVLVGDSHRLHSWKNMTQESRQTEILRPAAKELIRIERVERIPELMRRAFAVATSGRPGPVVVDVPEDICHATLPFEDEDFSANPAHEAAPALRCRPDRASTARAAALLAEARRPLVLAGGGVHISGAADVLTDFARACAIPVAHTMTGKGAIACTDPLSAGLFGRYDRIANALIEEADCLLVVGCKLGEIATKRYTVPPRGKTLIHLDIVAEEVARRRGEWRESVAERYTSQEVPVSMGRLMGGLNRLMPADGILVADGGFAAHWGGLLYDTKQAGRGFVPDRGFASIGYGLPGAIGAALAAPARQVVSLTGDGGFNMMLGELETARRMALDFAIIVVNNAASGYEGAAARHVRRGRLSRLRPRRDQLRQGREGARLHRHPRRGAGRGRAGARAGFPHAGAGRHRRRRHPRSGQDAARRRQPHGAGQEGGSGRVTDYPRTGPPSQTPHPEVPA